MVLSGALLLTEQFANWYLGSLSPAKILCLIWPIKNRCLLSWKMVLLFQESIIKYLFWESWFLTICFHSWYLACHFSQYNTRLFEHTQWQLPLMIQRKTLQGLMHGLSHYVVPQIISGLMKRGQLKNQVQHYPAKRSRDVLSKMSVKRGQYNMS